MRPDYLPIRCGIAQFGRALRKMEAYQLSISWTLCFAMQNEGMGWVLAKKVRLYWRASLPMGSGRQQRRRGRRESQSLQALAISDGRVLDCPQQAVVGVVVIDSGPSNQLMLDKNGWRHGAMVEDLET